MAQKVCIVGGGASGVALLWCLAKAQQQNSGDFEITLVHDVLVYDNGQPQPGIPSLGGHSRTVPVTVNGTEYWIDLGVQLIAPAMYPNMMSMLKLPQFSSVKMDPVPLKVACAFPGVTQGGPAQYWGNFPAYQTTSLYQQGASDAATFESLLKAQPGMLLSLQALLDADAELVQRSLELRDILLGPIPEHHERLRVGAARRDIRARGRFPVRSGLRQLHQLVQRLHAIPLWRHAVGPGDGHRRRRFDAERSRDDSHRHNRHRGLSRVQRAFGPVGGRRTVTGARAVRRGRLDHGHGDERDAARQLEQPTLELLRAVCGPSRVGSGPGFLLSAPGPVDTRPGHAEPARGDAPIHRLLGDPAATLRSHELLDDVLLQESDGRRATRTSSTT